MRCTTSSTIPTTRPSRFFDAWSRPAGSDARPGGASTTTGSDPWSPGGSGPVEPPPTRWRLPPPDTADSRGLVGLGADLEPGTLLAAYRSGLFPMPVGRRRLGWWSPDPRGVLRLDALHVSRSLRRSIRRYELRVDTAFDDVVVACADPSRSGRWINQAIVDAYGTLHRLGWTHSVEAWSAQGQLVGGLYGVAIAGLFAGESMFSRATDASKVALVGLVQHLRDSGMELLDVQWQTDHLATLGVVELPRGHYLELLGHAVASPASWAATGTITIRTPLAVPDQGLGD